MFRKCYLIVLMLFFAVSLRAGGDILEDYSKHLKKLQDGCKKVDELIRKKEQFQERERAQRRAERDARRNRDDDDDDDDDDNDDREHYRRRRKQIAEQRKKVQEQLNERRSELAYDFELHEQLAKELQNFINVNKIRGDYSFEKRSKDITKIFKSHGIGFDQEKGISLRHKSVLDPAYSFALLSYNLACLESAGVTAKSIPATYTNFSTYFRFYEQLEFYRIESNGFGSAKPTPSKEIEMKRRMEILLSSGKRLHQLLLKNNSKLAQELEIPTLLEMLEDHHKKYLFLEQSDFDARVSKMLDAPTVDQKKLAILKRDLAFRVKKLDVPAGELRVGKISGNTGDWFEAKMNRKKRRSKKSDPEPELSPMTIYFADDMSKVDSPAQEAAAGGEAAAAEKDNPAEVPAGTEEKTEERKMPTPAELRKYRSEVEAFRREYAGTYALAVEGLSSEHFPILKQTMTESMWQYFEKNNKRLVDAGRKPHRAAAEAYIMALSAEKQNADKISVQEMDAIRKFMKTQQE